MKSDFARPDPRIHIEIKQFLKTGTRVVGQLNKKLNLHWKKGIPTREDILII